jgi:nucleoid DNA-binding protein
MGEGFDRAYYDRLPEKVKLHVAEVTKSSGLPQTGESVEKISKCWLEKMRLFDEQTGALRMEEVGSFPKDSPKGALLFTYSGSLLSLGTSREGKRYAEYASIGLRKDVPDISKREGAELESDAAVGSVLSFRGGPIRSSSPLFKIVVCDDEVSLDEQEKRIREATIFLTNGFVKINRTHFGTPEEGIRQFTMKSMVGYVAAKNGITQKCARQVVEDFLKVVETGVLLGEKVRLPGLCKIFLTKKAARKARVGRHPITGAEITIKARPETFAPHVAFSRSFKEKTLGVRPDTGGAGEEPGEAEPSREGPAGAKPEGAAGREDAAEPPAPVPGEPGPVIEGQPGSAIDGQIRPGLGDAGYERDENP